MTVLLSLLDRNGCVHDKAGLNWGYSTGHVCKNDAYIPLKAHILRDNLGFFKTICQDNRIFVTWDDGTRMTLSLEGRQSINGLNYAKQISSYNDKSDLGDYLRSRLNVYDRPITLKDLQNYGRTNISATKVDTCTYIFDFSI